MKPLSRQLSRPDIDDLGEPQDLEPIFPDGTEPTLEAWQDLRGKLLGRWRAVIGPPSFGDFDRTTEVVERFEAPFFRGTIYRQPVAPGHTQQVLLMEPLDPPIHPRPAAVVPYYHPDLMAGFDLQSREPITERPNVHFGRHLVQQGYVVACMEAFPYNTVPEPAEDVGFACGLRLVGGGRREGAERQPALERHRQARVGHLARGGPAARAAGHRPEPRARHRPLPRREDGVLRRRLRRAHHRRDLLGLRTSASAGASPTGTRPGTSASRSMRPASRSTATTRWR